MRMKRGQSASGAAILVVTIAVLIILYIVILNPEDRAALLGSSGGDQTSTGGGTGGGGKAPADQRNVRQGFQQTPGNQILLQQNVGRIYPDGSSLLDHPVPSFTIFTKTNAQALRHAEHAYFKNGFFGKTKYNLTFNYDKNTMRNPLLSFVADTYDGVLSISLNDEPIFEKTLTTPTPPPIALPEEYLHANNVLTFEASAPGVAFWRVNEFSLNNILVTADVKDITASTAEHHFTLPEGEYNHLSYLQLTFTPNCDPRVAGRLVLRVNDKPLSSSYPKCTQEADLQISKDLLRPGDNSLFFLSEQSTYIIDGVNLRSILTGSSNPTFYFNIPMELFVALGGQTGGYGGTDQYGTQQGYGTAGGYPQGGYPGYGGMQQSYGGAPGGTAGGYGATASLIIVIRFADAVNQKVLTLNVNGFQNTIETTDLSYTTLIPPDYLIDGPNSIQLIPQGSPLDVAELRVEVQQAQ